MYLDDAVGGQEVLDGVVNRRDLVNAADELAVDAGPASTPGPPNFGALRNPRHQGTCCRMIRMTRFERRAEEGAKGVGWQSTDVAVMLAAKLPGIDSWCFQKNSMNLVDVEIYGRCCS